MNAGAFSVGESGPSGYAASLSADCSGSIAVGQTKTCTVTNDDQGATLIVIKHVINDNGGTAGAGDFTMSVTATNPSPASFPGSESGTGVSLYPGSYSVSESGPSGYAASYSADCSSTIALGQTKTCTVTNNDVQPKLIVIKHVINDNGGTAGAGDFTMSVTGASPSPASFAGAESPGTTVALNAGSYSVGETGPSGYSGSLSADCAGSIAVGETKTCTVTNDDQPGKLIVIKHVINDNGGTAVAGSFAMTVTGNSPSPASFAGAESPGTDVMLNAGPYSVGETGPSGYAASLSSDCTGTAVIGVTKTCTVTNDDIQPKLIVIKHVINDNGGTAVAGDFTMSVTGASPSPASFAGTESGTTVGLNAGAYNVGESGPSGYAASFSTDCTGTAVIGTTNTCTVTNDDVQPKLIVIKHMVNDNGGTAVAGDFTMSVTGTSPSPASSAGAESPGTTVALNAGSYSVGETGPAGYAASFSADCSGTIAVGETKTCTVTNNDVQPKLIVIKHVVNDNGGTAVAGDFTMSVTGTSPSPASFQGAESGTTVGLNAGSYDVSETGPSGYAASYSADCTGTAVIGTTKTCTVTNDDVQPKLIVIKHMVNDNGGLATASMFTMSVTGSAPSPASFPGSELGTTVMLNAGAYSVSESGPSGYAASYSGDCTGTAVIGVTKTCTVTNDDIQPRLTVTKVVNNNYGGLLQAGSFPLFVGGTPVATGVQNGFDAGTYAVTETQQTGYSFSGYSGDCDSFGNVVLHVGDVKSCTLTNRDIAPTLKLVKVVVPNGSSHAWTLYAIGSSRSFSDYGDSTTFHQVTAGVGYGLSESGPSGYDPSAWSCDGGSLSGSTITLALAQQVTCTITNTQHGSLNILKFTFPRGAQDVFGFTLSRVLPPPQVLSLASFSLTDGGSQLYSLSAGQYIITEGKASGWALMSISCTPSGAANVDVGNLQVTITLAAGANVVCTFTNAQSGFVTNSALCAFDFDNNAANGQTFRLLLTQDPASPAYYKVTATNPGQFFYNLIFDDTVPTTHVVSMSFPYPFVTQGATPIHVYDSVQFVQQSGSQCLVPGTPYFTSNLQVTLANYSGGSGNGLFGTFSSLVIQFTSPGGLAYLNVHLDYGLKATTGWQKYGTTNDAIGMTSPYTGVIIHDQGDYTFSFSATSDGSGSSTIHNSNAFKKDPGFAGLVVDQWGNAVTGTEVRIYNPDNSPLATVYTDLDGVYVYSYKYNGKGAYFTITLPSFGVSKQVYMKSNSFVWTEWHVVV